MFNSRLRKERARLGLTQPAFAEQAMVKKGTVINWEKGASSPTAAQLQSLSKAGVDVRYLVTGATDDYVYVSNHLVGDDEITLAFRKDWLARKKLEVKKLTLYKTKDDAMSPTIVQEDVLLLEVYFYTNKKGDKVHGLAEGEDLPHDGIYSIRINGRQTVKRLQPDNNGETLILSDNPSYESQSATQKQINKTVIGRVVWVGKDIT